MSEFLNVFSNINGGVVIVFMVCSLAMATFHSFIFKKICEKNFPSYLFYILNPILIGLGYLIYKPLGGVIFVILFLSVFVLALIGGVYSSIKDMMKYDNKKASSLKIWRKTLFYSIALVVMVISIVYFGFYAIIFYIVLYFIARIYSKSNKRFLKLQSILPTSYIRSMAMGLVEVKGKVEHIKLLSAPLCYKKCIGYRYVIEEIDNNKDGQKSYTKVQDIVVCNDFYLIDSTGRVRVEADDIDFLWMEKSDQQYSKDKRYTQYLLSDTDEVLLIGKASTKNKEVIIEREPIENIFMLAPVYSVNKWNKYKPLLNSFIIATVLISIVIIFILLADVSVVNNIIYFR